MKRETINIQKRAYEVCLQDHGAAGFDLIVYQPAGRSLRDRLLGSEPIEIGRVNVKGVDQDELIVLALGRGYARCRLRVVHDQRGQGVGRWLLRQAVAEAQRRGIGLAGELQAGHPERAERFYRAQGAQVVHRPLYPTHPWIVMEGGRPVDGQPPLRWTAAPPKASAPKITVTVIPTAS